MSRLLRRFTAAILVVVVGGVASLAGPVSAAPPETEKAEFEFEFTATDACGEGSDVHLLFERVSEEIRFTDGDGTLTREIRAFRSEVSWTRLDNGNTATDRNRVTRIDTYEDGELVRSVFNGPRFTINVPGEGAVVLVAGRIVVENGETVFEKGPNNLSDLFGTVCAALA